MDNTYMTIIFILLFFLIILYILVNYGLKATLMSERKDKIKMLEELWQNFNTDYRQYENLPSEEISIKSHDNINLKGVYHNIYPDSKKIILINHGYTANRYVCYQFIDVFIEENFNILLIDMRSHGESDGDYASYGYNESEDIGSWVKWIKSRLGESTYIGLHGQSMGAATVMIYGATHFNEIKFVIEDCGFTTAKDAIKYQFKQAKIPFWPLYDLIRFKAKNLYKFDLNHISPLEKISSSSVPTLFIHGANDKIVPSWMAKNLFESKKGEKDYLYLVDDADHMRSYSTDMDEYKNVVRNFLRNL